MKNTSLTISSGIAAEHTDQAARLYDIAFAEKLALGIPDAGERLSLLAKCLQLVFAIGAFSNGRLVGIAGFSTAQGSLTGGIGYRELLSELGWIKGNRAALVFSLYERQALEGELLMDGIVVDPEYRGKGVGTQLFARLMDDARSSGYATIRLDVIDTNQGARKLYERLGFRETETQRFEFLRRVLGFGASTTMIYQV